MSATGARDDCPYCNWHETDEPCSQHDARRVITLPHMANKPSMEVNISFRVPRALRDAAREKAEERQENVSDVLRAALERYVKKK